jgi:hypothetical protein
MAKITHTKIKQPSFGEKRSKLTYTKFSDLRYLVSLDLHYNTLEFSRYYISSFFLNKDNVGEFLMSRLFQSEMVDGINKLVDVLSLHLGGT